MYTNVSIPKLRTGAGAPKPKKPNVRFYKVVDIQTWPETDGVVSTTNLTLKAGKKGVAVYFTPKSISRNDNSEGDSTMEMAGFLHNVAGTRPGDDEFFCAWLQENLNEGLVAITEECGDNKGTRLHGTPCNPLYMSTEGQDNQEGIGNNLTFVSSQRQEKKSIHYRGALPAVHDDASLVVGSGSAGDGV